MLNNKSLWLRAAAPVAVLSLALTACGGDDGADDKAEKSPGASAPAGSEEPASDGALGEGESATAEVEEEGGAKITYDIVAQKVSVGTEKDAAELVGDPAKAKGLAPAVAYVKYTNKAGGTVADSPEVFDNVKIQADGRPGTILIGASEDASGCEDEHEIENWKAGESHVVCQTYMVPVGAKELEVHWAPEEGDPFIWKFANS